MSGGTRCNLTHATDKWGIVRAYGEQGNFLHSALAALSPADLVKLIEDEGVPTKVEETGKIFPVSNRATDVLDALLRRLHRSGAELALRAGASESMAEGGGFRLITAKRDVDRRQRSSSPSAASRIPAAAQRATAMPGRRHWATRSFRRGRRWCR